MNGQYYKILSNVRKEIEEKMKETDGGKGSYKVNTFIFKELTITIN